MNIIIKACKSVNIRKRMGKNRPSYEYSIELVTEDGQRKRISKSGFLTASDAKAAGQKALRANQEALICAYTDLHRYL